MKTILIILATALFILPSGAAGHGTPGIGDITRALGAGDVASLATFMDAEVELSILNEEDLYTRDQASQKLRGFFSKHKPAGFSQVHQGSSKADDAEYCIGNLSTAAGVFRVYIYVAKRGNGMVLQELRFDRE